MALINRPLEFARMVSKPPTPYSIDPTTKRVRIPLSGPPASWDVHGVVERLLEDSCLGPGFDILCDYTAAEHGPSMEVIVAGLPLARRLLERLGPFRCALVVGGLADFGLANRAVSLASVLPGFDAKAFQSVTDAEAWLEES